jgi:hypothetical protein
MAKQVGLFPIEGTLENVTFFKTAEGGYQIRKKSGISKTRIMTDPAFVRTRENLSQFGLNASAGKIIRDAIPSLLRKGKDNRVSSRLSALMSLVAKEDHSSVLGKKSIAIATTTPQGLELLKGFNFNKRAVLENILGAPIAVDMTTGVVTLADLIPQDDLEAPPTATHVGFRSGFSAIDFATAQSTTAYSPVVQLPLDLSVNTVTLTPASTPASGAGIIMMATLLIEFYKEVDGVKYALKNGEYNTLSIIDLKN